MANTAKKTASLSEKYTEKMQLSYLAQLSGKLHDVGKLTADFMGYICGENSFRRGELDHSFAGARYICEAAKKPAQKG